MPCLGSGSVVQWLGANCVLSGPQLEIWTNPLSRKGLDHVWGPFQGSCGFVHPGPSPSVKGRVFQMECCTTRTRGAGTRRHVGVKVSSVVEPLRSKAGEPAVIARPPVPGNSRE